MLSQSCQWEYKGCKCGHVSKYFVSSSRPRVKEWFWWECAKYASRYSNLHSCLYWRPQCSRFFFVCMYGMCACSRQAISKTRTGLARQLCSKVGIRTRGASAMATTMSEKGRPLLCAAKTRYNLRRWHSLIGYICLQTFFFRKAGRAFIMKVCCIGCGAVLSQGGKKSMKDCH